MIGADCRSRHTLPSCFSMDYVLSAQTNCLAETHSQSSLKLCIPYGQLAQRGSLHYLFKSHITTAGLKGTSINTFTLSCK